MGLGGRVLGRGFGAEPGIVVVAHRAAQEELVKFDHAAAIEQFEQRAVVEEHVLGRAHVDVGFEPGFVAGGVGDEDVLGGEALQRTLARGGNGGAVEVAG